MSAGSTGCDSSGNLPTEFEPMDALTAWVEKNQAPEQIIVVHKTNGKIDRSRPLCPYPQVANYKGSGNTNDASHFACQIPSK
jgi:feruloyl esterase